MRWCGPLATACHSVSVMRDLPMPASPDHHHHRALAIDRLHDLKLKAVQFPVPADHLGGDLPIRASCR